jgi:hypothetical protein
MKHLLNGVATVAALAIAVPVWAQPYGAGSGTQADQPVNPRAPYSRPVPPGWSQPGAAMPPGSMGATDSATPPMHRPARHVSTHHVGKAKHPPEAMSGTTAAQLNQEELARLQSGNFANPPAPPPPRAMPPAR